jgi:hypothetical protein
MNTVGAGYLYLFADYESTESCPGKSQRGRVRVVIPDGPTCSCITKFYACSCCCSATVCLERVSAEHFTKPYGSIQL